MPRSPAQMRAVQDLDVRRYRMADAQDIIGMDIMQIHNVAKTKLQLADWGVGKGKSRLLSLAELFAFRLISQVVNSVPPKALRDLAECGSVYLKCVTSNAELRAKSACILGYRDKRGSYWWLLCHSGMLPDNPPPLASDVLLVVRVKAVLADVLARSSEALWVDPDERTERPEPKQPVPFREPVMAGGPADDLQVAAMAFSRPELAGAAA